ncbi:MAG: ABC transporter ATP-binding protein/permease [Solobacterium sp.]|jgi:ATP-binding cassette subfamily B protein|nr:ABC transporter ATP-binding protein/permease [Solobacterium sp.]MCH4205449.1 ABC transporter ATP-binding protein/permease [Solobacterium sp.]MCH4226661.1 ABC transporter ATP-binding protein/permease [Solobacterium sp.]MCH4282136.1 ABC transporter ATP-binding protein/permease [Solobacterium sp.]
MEKKDRFQTRTQMIMYFLRGSKRYFAVSIFFACMVSVFDLINPKIISFTVDSLLDSQTVQLPSILNSWIAEIGGMGYLRTHLWLIACAVLFVAALGALSRFLFNLYNSIGAEHLVKTMRDSLFDHILHLPFSWHSENHTGDIIQRCTSDVEQIKMFLSEQLTALFRIIVMICLTLYFMFSMNWKLALAAAVFIPIVVCYSFFFHTRIGSSFEKADIEEGKLSSIVQENLTGVRVVRAFGREKYEQDRFDKQNGKYTGMWVHLMKLLAAFWMSSDLFSYGQVIAVLAYGSVLAVHGEITPGNYIAFVSYTMMLMWPIRNLGRVISNLSKAGISIDRLRYIMNSETEQDLPQAKTPDMSKDIVFDNVSYQYDNGSAEILDHVSFTVKAGSTVGILGGTGSGKSTLMYLLDRLYDLKDGTISIGGVDIREMKAEWVRQNVGMVLQEPYLFSRSLGENIKIAEPEADIEEIQHAAKIASLDHAVEHFKEGYETFVGERGVTLSGGQKQRAAIAQMLIRKPPIMVFDDSLSAVDAETDAKIRASLKENTGGSTVILIAHRITTLMKADQIIVMDQGKISEAGTHEELMAKNGIYKKIYDLQSRSSAEEVQV